MTNAEKKTNPSYRTAGSAVPGPDYVCSKCGAFGLRLWRQTNTFADHLELLKLYERVNELEREAVVQNRQRA